MSFSFEELDYCQSALGELILRRRRPVSMPDTWVYEVKLDGNFLMSSLMKTSEEELVNLALPMLDGGDWRVLVGGLGLGYTAAAALAWDEVQRVDVIEFLPEVMRWHADGMVPMGEALHGDPRCHIIEDDCFALLRRDGGDPYDAVLIDIDDGPEELLSEAHGAFYSVEGLREARRSLRAGGVFGLWTSYPTNTAFLERLGEAFQDARAEEVVFRNLLMSLDETNTIYLARA